MALFTIYTLALLATAIHAYIPCSDPTGHVGHFVGRDQECAALVQATCHRQPGNVYIGQTQTWKRGVHVHEHCGKIPRYTAVATFLGPGNTYDTPQLHQHTAIFVSCDGNGMRIYDQQNGVPVRTWVMPWAGAEQNGADHYYTIA